MALGRAAAHRERLAAQTALLERLSDMPLEELSRHVNGWHRALRATGTRPRKFDATRHTFETTAPYTATHHASPPASAIAAPSVEAASGAPRGHAPANPCATARA